ncbi:TonB-dependent receptor [Luteimonas sp. SJ-92]|uniref:TonB-dependent receptor n=1 Tax=Luteimonas salinisoli TaxID=2752307 RepID=A0A853JDA5_9GAMM|nr:TonB-dependent receptor [Luteimonas salinisoli]NZA27283.1 TonB-dependent receptor [Luteimonas salinisoli]
MTSPNPCRLAFAVQLSLLLAVPAVAGAQESTEERTRTLDAVQVTGTRIKRAEIEGQVPVHTVTREDIDRSGLTSIGDVIQQLSGSGSALNTKFNSSGNFGFPPDGSGVGAGSAQVDLRHLGSKRVLVLVDGIRWVNEASASGVGASTDLNTIPLAIVERIEVLEDGASSLYGSDAIAGVVNIITRRDFDGGQVTLNYGEFGEGDGTVKGVDFAWGRTTERSNLFLGLSHVDQGVVYSRTREQSRFPTPGTGVAFGSSGTPTGRFIVTDPNTGATHDITPNTGDSDPTYDPTQTGCDRTDGFHCFTNADRFNFAEYNLLMTPSERTGVFGQFRFDISPGLQWYAKALYNRRESTNQAAPEPIFLGPEAGTGNPQADGIFISALNPYNPFGFDLDSSDNLILIGRRPVEGGARVFEQEVDTAYVSTGLEGSFDVRDTIWFWDVNAAYSKNKAEQTNYGSYNIRNIALGLGDPAACAAVAGCVPLNIFGGPGTITPEMLAWIQPVVHDESENELTLVSANLSGDLFRMPGEAGYVAFAAGYEYRKYEGWYQPDPLTVRGDYNGVPSLPTSGEYDVNEVFVEFNVPIFADSPLGKRLDLNLAGRYSDYSTFGGEFTPKYGLRWQVTDDFLMRATYAEGFRAPSIGELFGSDSRFDAQLRDPCSEPFLDPSLEPNCRTLGVPAGYAQPNPQISVTTGGNSELEPERARSFTTGFVWSPWFASGASWSERLDFEVTFYRHDIQGPIQALSAQAQLDLCVETLDPLYCDGIGRAATGGINAFNNRLTNLGSIKTDGWDVDLYWTLPAGDAGQFKLAWQNSFVTRYEAIGVAGQRQPREPGVEVEDSAIPEWTSTATLDWSREAWRASWAVRHISELTEDCGAAVAFPVCSDQARGLNTLDATTYHDVQLGYRFDWMRGLELTAGVNNVFDKDPPICLSCSLNGYDASTYDIPGGRFWYLRADLRF